MAGIERIQYLQVAKMLEQSQRYEDIVQLMLLLVKQVEMISHKQIQILLGAYKNIVSKKRQQLRKFGSIQFKQQSSQSKYLKILKQYKQKVLSEVEKLCEQVAGLVDNSLLLKTQNIETQVLLYKTKADYFKYAAENQDDYENSGYTKIAEQNYKNALSKAQQKILIAKPIRLALAMNYAVFFYDIKNDVASAVNLVDQTFNQAIKKIEKLSEQQYQESLSLLQQVKDYHTMWTMPFISQ